MRAAGDHCDELLAAYVLGACPRTEAEGIAEHLAQCARCATAAQRLREGADMLLARVAPMAPTSAVKDRVMAPVRAEAALFEAARQGAYAPRRPGPASPSRSRRLLPRVRPWTPIPAAAVAALLIVLAVGAGLLSGDLGSGAPKRSVVAAQIESAPDRGAAVSLEIRGDRAELRVRGLGSPGRDRVHQVWLRRHRQAPEPAGAMLEADSRGSARARLSGDIGRFDELLVTSEPAGGSLQPTQVPVLEVAISA